MYTQCTECKNQQTLTIKELRSSQGLIRCSECSSMFNALELVSETPLANIADYHETSLAKEKISRPFTHWKLGIALCLTLLSFQLYFFEGYNLTQHALLRPWLSKACQTFNCKIPTYKNLSELSILHGSFQAASEHHYIFRTAFSNQSNFEQNYPSIKLTLQNYSGDDFAERVFRPQDYMTQTFNIMTPDTSTEIALDIAIPSSKIGGYRFEFI